MLVNKIMPFQTPEEIEKKNKIIYEFIEKIYPFNKNNYDTQTVSKYAKKCMLDILQIEDKAKKRYILSFNGDKDAITRDVAEILDAITPAEFQKDIFGEEPVFPEIIDYFSLRDLDNERNNTDNYKRFCFYLTQVLHSQVSAFRYYGFPLEEIENLIRKKAGKHYKAPEGFDKVRIFEEEEKKNALPKVDTKKLDNIIFPLDKVNSTLWYGFPVGTVKGLKAESTRDSNDGKQANILLLLDFTALNGVNINISRELTVYDKWVWNACANLKEQGHDVITAEQIYKAMGNSGRPNAKLKEKILESVETISRARVSIDTTAENELYPKYDKFRATFPLLSTEICTASARGQIVEDAIRIIETPKLFSFAEDRKQVTRLPVNVLDSPISKTEDNLLLSDYLLTRISKMRNNPSIPKTILLETIYQKCEVRTYKQKQRLPEKIERILTHYKNIGWINDYKLNSREINIKIS